MLHTIQYRDIELKHQDEEKERFEERDVRAEKRHWEGRNEGSSKRDKLSRKSYIF